MRQLLCVAMLLVCTSAKGQEQFPVGTFKTTSFWPGETPLTFLQQLAKTFPQYQDAYFNFGVPFIAKSGGILSDSEMRQMLDSAAAHNVKLIIPDVVSRYAGFERLYFDATDDYFEIRQGLVVGGQRVPDRLGF